MKWFKDLTVTYYRTVTLTFFAYPFFAYTYIVHVPLPTAFITPFSVTVATFLSEDANLSSFAWPSESGFFFLSTRIAFPFIVAFFPTFRLNEVLLSLMPLAFVSLVLFFP